MAPKPHDHPGPDAGDVEPPRRTGAPNTSTDAGLGIPDLGPDAASGPSQDPLTVHADLRSAARPPSVVEAFIAAQPEPTRSTLWLCRDYLHRTAPGLSESIKWGVPTFMLERNRFYLNPRDDHVVLGFVSGAQMIEFHGVFDHVATEVAHVLVRTSRDLERPGLRDAVRAAAGYSSDRDFGEALRSKAQLAGQAPSTDGDRLMA